AKQRDRGQVPAQRPHGQLRLGLPARALAEGPGPLRGARAGGRRADAGGRRDEGDRRGRAAGRAARAGLHHRRPGVRELGRRRGPGREGSARVRGKTKGETPRMTTLEVSSRSEAVEETQSFLKTGEQFLEELRDGREVIYRGERIDDVTTHPAT